MNISGNTILITGGATGFGFALAKAFTEKENTVIICDINEEKLNEAKIHIPELHSYVCDISRKEGREMLFRGVVKAFPQLNILINNAGIAQPIDYTQEMPSSSIVNEIDTNFTAPLELTRKFLPSFLKKSNAAIINICSPAGFRPQYSVPLYTATKAGLTLFSESLRNRLRHQLNNKAPYIIDVFPPCMDTNMTAPFNVKKIPADVCAQKVLEGMAKNKKQIWIYTKEVQIVYFISRVLISILRFPHKIVREIKKLFSGEKLSW